MQTFNCALVLPTYEDKLKYYLWVKHENEEVHHSNKFTYSVSQCVHKVACKIEEIWTSASLPVISQRRVQQRVKDYYEKFTKLKKNLPMKSRKRTEFLIRSKINKKNDNRKC